MTRRRRGDPAATGPFERPFDAFLLGLRLIGHEYRLLPEPPTDAHERAVATCPRCRQTGCLTLEITEPREGSEVVLDCWSGCADAAIRQALAGELCSAAGDELLARAA